MIDHVTIRVLDLEKSKAFYEKAFAPLGYKVSFGKEGIFYAFDIGNGFLFEIAKHQDQNSITSTHITFRVSSHQKVHEFYEFSLKNKTILKLNSRSLHPVACPALLQIPSAPTYRAHARYPG